MPDDQAGAVFINEAESGTVSIKPYKHYVLVTDSVYEKLTDEYLANNTDYTFENWLAKAPISAKSTSKLVSLNTIVGSGVGRDSPLPRQYMVVELTGTGSGETDVTITFKDQTTAVLKVKFQG